LGRFYEPSPVRHKAKAGARLLLERTLDAKELTRRAKERAEHREVRRQRNIERIIELAKAELPETVNDRPVDEDWVAYFFTLSQDVGDEVMQTLWARILAGEVGQPGSYSLRTLGTVRTLRKEDAHLFSRYCCYVWEMGNGAKGVLTSTHVNRWLAEHGFSSLELERLRNLQLVGSALRYSLVEVEFAPSAYYFGEQYRFSGSLISILSRYVSAVHLTDVGAELFPLSGARRDPEYLDLLIRSLKDEDGIVVSRVDAS
jgi:hypothetical protein